MKEYAAAFRIVIALGLLCAAPAARALGLATSMGKVFVANVPVGSTVSIRDLTGMAYKVTNTSANTEDVLVSIEAPKAGEGILSPDFEPIPDSSWISLSKTEFRLAPGQQGVADILINVPKDKKHLEKKYQVSLWARTLNKGLLAVGLKSRLMLTMSPSLMSRDEIKQAKQLADDLDFHLSPSEVTLDDLPLGAKVFAKQKTKKMVKLINLSDKPMRLKLGAIDRVRAGFGSIPGVDEGVGTLTPASDTLLIEPNSVGLIDFAVEIPKDKQYAGKKFLFVLQAELQDQAVPVSAYCLIVVSTEKGDK